MLTVIKMSFYLKETIVLLLSDKKIQDINYTDKYLVLC